MRYSGVLLAAVATIPQTRWLAILFSTLSSFVLPRFSLFSVVPMTTDRILRTPAVDSIHYTSTATSTPLATMMTLTSAQFQSRRRFMANRTGLKRGRSGGGEHFMRLEMLLQCRRGRRTLIVLDPFSPCPPLFVCLYAQWCSNYTASLPFSAFLHPDTVSMCGTTSWNR